MNLKIPKRTDKIDSEREKLIGYGPMGPIWTEAGATTLNGDQKEELSFNLKAKQKHSAVQQVVLKVLEAGAGFFESVVLQTAPESVRLSYQSDNPKLFVDWLVNSGFKTVQEGLTSIVLRNGEEIARSTAAVPAWLSEDVLTMLKFEQVMEGAKV